MEYLIGVVLGVVVCVFALLTGFDRDRAFYPTVLAVIPTYYILFAAMGSSTQAVVIESTVTCAFWALAVVGFKKNLWLIAAGLAGHGVFDFFHHGVIQNPGVPAFWPGFCGSIDVFLGAFLAVLLMMRSAMGSASSNGIVSPPIRSANVGPSTSSIPIAPASKP
jgi:hypothetical protein